MNFHSARYKRRAKRPGRPSGRTPIACAKHRPISLQRSPTRTWPGDRDETRMTITAEGRRVQIEAETRSQIQVLAEEIRRRRKEQDLSLEALASLSGVSRSMISKIERGEAVPSTA